MVLEPGWMKREVAVVEEQVNQFPGWLKAATGLISEWEVLPDGTALIMPEIEYFRSASAYNEQWHARFKGEPQSECTASTLEQAVIALARANPKRFAVIKNVGINSESACP